MPKNIFKKNSVIDNYRSLINEINSFEDKIQCLTDSELRDKTLLLKNKYKTEQNFDSITSEAFAIVRETSLRTLGLRHFDVQLLGGLVLNDGKIAEMRTGEGKTLVATLPAYLNALTDKGVHIVTVNDYLANRDQVSMGQVYRFLGLDTGLIQENMTIREKKQNYTADITYVTNAELGFDYLRDNMAINFNDIVLRPFNYCIIDEIDSILIDEAQTPLILSRPIPTSTDKFLVTAEIMKYLRKDIHFRVDQKKKNVLLTERGTIQVENMLGINDLYNIDNPWIPYIMNGLKAKALFYPNTNYIVKDEQIVIVDEFTGRIMPDRRWSDGLHQAVEAKECVPIREISETAASITYKNFFLLYPKLSGMTGTAKTDEFEFEKVYGLSVDKIPTARTPFRKDLPDLLYKDQLSKWNAIVEECKKVSNSGQPILIGTTTIEKSEMLAQLLKESNLSFQLLNARPENVKRESEIIAQAGKKGSITISTNMAGRGTDIILGGNSDFKVKKQLYNILTRSKNKYKLSLKNNLFNLLNSFNVCSQKFLSVLNSVIRNKDFIILNEIDILTILNKVNEIRVPKNSYECSIRFLADQLLIFEEKKQNLDKLIVKNLGGLYVIGTERNDSRRIDNQLRGRCGRQGDPGKSRFFLSLDDDLFRLFGSPDMRKFMQDQFTDDDPLEFDLLAKSLDAAQKRVEEQSYDSRRYLYDYDDILNKQRNVVYYERRQILKRRSVRDLILGYGEQVIAEIIKEIQKDPYKSDQALFFLESFLGTHLSLNLFKKYGYNYLMLDSFELETYLFQEFWVSYELKLTEFEICQPVFSYSFERTVILVNIDNVWKEHLQKMSILRDSVGWRGYGQRNPLFEYKEEAYNLFQKMGRTIRSLVIFDIMTSKLI